LDEVRRRVGELVDREGLTQRALVEIKVLTELLPEAVAALQGNLKDEDPKIRENAALAILKYTVGARQVQPEADPTATAMTLNFGIPLQHDAKLVDPEDAASVLGTAEDAPEPEPRQCVECEEWKPPAEFVGESSRCQACHDRMLGDISARFPGLLGSGHGR
jgi:hypothetical protein